VEGQFLMTKRVISKFEEKVIRLCHHDFEGLTQQKAAKQLQCSQALISRTISCLKKKVPQLFPILTKKQIRLRDYIIKNGLTHQEIAMLLGVSKDTVDSRIMALKAKGVCFEKPRKMLQYENWMDGNIKQKF